MVFVLPCIAMPPPLLPPQYPITMTGIETKDKTLADKLRNTNYLQDEFLEAKREFKDTLLPFLLELTNKNKKITVLLLEAEQILPEKFEFDQQRNFYIRRYNGLLRALIPDTGIIGKNIYRMSLTNKVILGEYGEYLLPDRIHLARKDKPTVTPPTLLTNMNAMFNLLCNRFFEDEEKSYCCQGEEVRNVL